LKVHSLSYQGLFGHEREQVLTLIGQRAPNSQCASVIHWFAIKLGVLLKQWLPLEEVIVVEAPNDDAHEV
jgi:hypothetical protein